MQLNKFDCVLVLLAVFNEKYFDINIKIPEFEKLKKCVKYLPFSKLHKVPF